MEKFLNIIIGIQTALAQSSSGTASSSTTSAATSHAQSLIDSLLSAFPFWITGIVVMILSFFLAKIVKSVVENRMTDAGMEEEHQEVQIVASRTAYGAVLLIGITAGLKIAGLDLTSILAAAAFGIGFAMQDIILNIISGIIILLQKQFTIGDWVKVNGTEGIIKNIQSRYTIIKKFDGTNVVVPNSDLFKNQVNSLTSNPERRFQINIGVDLYMDLKEVIDQLYKSIDKCEKILKHPKPSIIVQQPGPYYNSIRIRAWVISKKGILRPISALMRQIHKDFYRKGWSFPYQVNQVYFDKDGKTTVPERAQNYIDKHKHALKKQPQIQQQQQQMLNQQEQAPAGAPLPQAQQIGVGGPEMQAPVWLQQAAGQNPQPAPTPNQPQMQPQDQSMPQQQFAPAQPAPQNFQPYQPQAFVENIQYDPGVKVVSNNPIPQVQPQPQMAMPIVAAPPITAQPSPESSVAPPLPDMQPPINLNQE